MSTKATKYMVLAPKKLAKAFFLRFLFEKSGSIVYNRKQLEQTKSAQKTKGVMIYEQRRID
jgi:hypothetical protein